MADHEITEAYRFHFKVDARTAKREIAAYYVEEKRRADPSPMDWVASDATSISQRVSRQEEYQRLMDVLRRLSPLEQYVTVARVLEGLSSQEIAALTGKTTGAVRMIVTRVRDKLREHASPEPEEESESDAE
jgi:RNA polymerase sigma factor (sigma-70 family)